MDTYWQKTLECCTLCPRNCGVNRLLGERGYCHGTVSLSVARAALHMWEEPCLSGKEGAGTVFFTGCNLRCIYCQNYEIAEGEHGAVITPQRLAEIFLELQRKKANNIDLVTPTHYTPVIAEAITNAKKQGLTIPVVYNCGGYESVETLRHLEGLVDIWMPDMKYGENELAKSLSGAGDYVERSREALAEMVRQQPAVIFDDRNMMKKGVLVRHLVLPGHLKNSRSVLEWLWDNYHNQIWLSLMSQYTPLRKFPGHSELDRSLTKREYERITAFAGELGFVNAYVQEPGVDKNSFIPAFDLSGVLPENK